MQCTLGTLLKDSFLISVLKGRGFKPRRESHRIVAALAAAGLSPQANRVFQQPVMETLAVLVFSFLMSAQNAIPTFKAEAAKGVTPRERWVLDRHHTTNLVFICRQVSAQPNHDCPGNCSLPAPERGRGSNTLAQWSR